MATKEEETTPEAKTDAEYPTSPFCENLQKLILSLHKVIWVHTQEENRCFNEIQRAVEYLRTRPTYHVPQSINFGNWTLTSGLKAWANPRCKESPNETNKPENLDCNAEQTMQPEDAIAWVEKFAKEIVVVFRDMHQVLTAAGPTRRLKDFICYCDTHSRKQPPIKTIIIVSPVLDIPIELEKSVTVIDFALPNEQELSACLENALKSVANSKNKEKKPANQIPIPTDEEKREVVSSARGLTFQEFEDAIAKCFIEKKKPDPASMIEQKKQIILKNGVLEMLQPVPMNDVGGLDRLKNWLEQRNAGWTREGREYGLTTPRGVLLLGIQGCGKSLASSAIADAWRLPLYRLDIGRLFNSAVGSSESNMRNVLKIVEALSPCIISLDELDKMASGSGSSNFSDAGVTSRLLGHLLTWLSDHKSEVFIVATANSVENLPPELLRAGRFDATFYVDLPEAEEREDIFKIHIRKVNRNPDNFDTKRLGHLSPHFSGAEIEVTVKNALINSFNDGELKDHHLTQAINEIVPLWDTKRDDIVKLIEWVGRNEEKKDGIKAKYASSKSFNVPDNTEGNVVSMKVKKSE